MADAPSQTQDKFIVRLPDGMRERIKRAADVNNRSMNAEIVATLEEAYPAPKTIPVGVLEMAEYLTLIESAKSDDERAVLLASANAGLLGKPETRDFEIRLAIDPQGSTCLAVGRRERKAGELLQMRKP